jgi:hypothetical protein
MSFDDVFGGFLMVVYAGTAAFVGQVIAQAFGA